MNDKDINNLKEMLVDFNEYSTDYTKTRCKELEKTINNTLQEIERLNNIIREALNYIDDNTYYKDHKGHINIDDVYTILKGVDK